MRAHSGFFSCILYCLFQQFLVYIHSKNTHNMQRTQESKEQRTEY